MIQQVHTFCITAAMHLVQGRCKAEPEYWTFPASGADFLKSNIVPEKLYLVKLTSISHYRHVFDAESQY